MAVTFVSVGAASSAQNSSVTPGAPSGSLVGDLYVAFITARSTSATYATPSGWTVHSSLNPHRNGSVQNTLYIFWKAVTSNGEAPPTFVVSSNGLQDTTIGQVACFRGADTSNPWRTIGTFLDGINTQNIGTIPGISVLANNLALCIAHKADDWTSVATLTADGDTWVEIAEPDETAGNDAGIVWDYMQLTANRTLSGRTFTVTGGGSNVGCGVMLEIAAGTSAQTMSPSAVAIPVTVPTPTIAKGPISKSPSPVAIPFVTTTPTITKVKALAPAALAIPLVIPTPIISVVTPPPADMQFVFTPAKEKLAKGLLSPLTQAWRAMLVMSNTTVHLNQDAEFISDITTLDECNSANYVRHWVAYPDVIRDDANNRAFVNMLSFSFDGISACSRPIAYVVLFQQVGAESANPLIACLGRGGSSGIVPDGTTLQFQWSSPLGLLAITGESSSLLTDLVAYWKLNETSGNALDSVGTNTLTDVNTVTSTLGVVGTSRRFTASSTEYFMIADNAALSMGDIDFTIAAWVYFGSVTGSPIIAGKYQGSGDQREYAVWLNSSTNRLGLIISSNGTTPGQVVLDASSFGSINLGTWYFVVTWHDSVNNTLNIQVNNGTVDSVAHSAGVFNGTAPFQLGALGGPSQYLDGRIDEVGIWKRVLTATERTTLFNGENGLTYPFT